MNSVCSAKKQNKDFEIKTGANCMLLYEHLKKTADLYPDLSAVVMSDRKMTFRELYDYAFRAAGKLCRLGVGKGDFITIELPRSGEYIAVLLAAWMRDAAVAVLDSAYPAERLDYIAKDCNARVRVNEAFLEGIENTAPLKEISAPDPFDPCLLVYTSGSTGRPKGVLHTHQSVFDSVYRSMTALDFHNYHRLGEHFGDTVPFSFVAGLQVAFGVLASGMTLYIVPYEALHDPVMLADITAANELNMLYLPPKLLKLFRPKGNTLHTVITGSEKVTAVYRPEFKIVNGYGSSESAGGILYFEIDKEYDNTPIGKGWGQEGIYLLDENNNEADEGELCLTGNFAVEYLHQPEQSAKTFVHNPFAEKDGFENMLRTGDICRRLPDGNYVYVNRKDWMIKINGQRVEPGEIEAALRTVKGVNESVVKDFVGNAGQIYICAYYTLKPDAEVTEDDLRVAAADRLPAYMIPAFFVKLDTMPVNANGKLDRKALKAPDITAGAADYVAPKDALEEQLCNAYAKVLGLERAGMRDDFFHLGGDSIRVMALQEMCGSLGISTRMIYECRTPEKLAERIRNTDMSTSAAQPGEVPSEPVPLNQSQIGIYLSCVHREGEIAYNNPILLRFPADTDTEKLCAAVGSAVENHLSLSAKIVLDGEGMPAMQYVPFDEGETVCRILEMTEKELVNNKQNFVKPFLLHRDRLCRFCIIRTEEAVHLFMDFHHIIFDGYSMKILLPEMIETYLGKTYEKESYTAYYAALDEKRERDSEAYDIARKWNVEKFGNVDGVSLPEGDLHEDNTVFGEKKITLSVSAGELTAFCKAGGITESVLTTAAFGRLLSSYTMSSKTAFATAYNGRQDSRTLNTVSMFVRTLPVLCNTDPKQSVKTYLECVKEQLLGTMANSLFSFAELSAVSGYSSSVNFLWQGDMFTVPEWDGIKVEREALPFNATGEPISIQLYSENGKLIFDIQYHSSRYSGEWIDRFAKGYEHILRELMTRKQMAEVSLLDKAEEEKVLSLSKGEALECDTTLTWIDHFLSFAEKCPDKTAVVAQNGSYTYGELDRVSDSVASWLSEKGVGDNEFVAVRMNRVKEFHAAIIGINKAGAAYIPIDPAYPEDRIAYMLEDSGTVIVLDEDTVNRIAVSHANAEKMNKAAPEKRAYMIYTSGSTGKPKGAVISHLALHTVTAWAKKLYELSETSRNMGHPSFSFDASMLDLIPPLCYGGETHILSETTRLDLEAMAEYIIRNDINGMATSTQLGMALANAHPDLKMRYIMMGGEKMLPCTKPSFRLLNAYGPTEFTIVSSVYEFNGERDKDIPIGRPVPGSWSLICDLSGNLLPVGMTGELCLVGDQIGEGYWNRPSLTAEKFCECRAIPSRKMYHTGDLVRYNEDGELEFIGRMDTQVKLRGFRIELGEVEHQAVLYKDVEQAVAEVRRDLLVLYYTSENEVDENALREEMSKSLTEYMVPSVFIRMDAMPMTPGGKIDRKALPEPKRSAGEIVAPRTKAEKKAFDCLVQVLGYDDVGVTMDYSDAGLTSIGAMRFAAKLSEAFRVPFRAAELVTYPTIEKLAIYITGIAAEKEYDIREEYPLTMAQKGILTEVLTFPDTTIYNIPVIIDLPEGIQTDRLRDAIIKTVDAHPYLKTLLKADEHGEIRVLRRDNAAAEASEVDEDTLKDGARSLVRPFDILNESLYRAVIVHGKNGDKLFWDAHHIIFDGISLNVFLDDVQKAYAGEELSAESYTEFEEALSEEDRRNTEAFTAARKWYAELLDGRDTECLPMRDINCMISGVGVVEMSSEIDKKAVEAFAKETCTTVNSLWIAATGLVLARSLTRDNSLFTTVYHGRGDARLSHSTGMFVHTLPVVCTPFAEQNAVDYIRNTGEQLRKSMAHDIFSFAELAKEFGIRADILFVYEGDIGNSWTIDGKPVKKMDILSPNRFKAPIMIAVSETDDGFGVHFEYDKARYKPWSMNSLAQSIILAFKALLAGESPKDISLLTDERRNELISFNESKAEYEKTDIITLFRRQCKEAPDKPAVICNDICLTYREADEITDRLACELVRRGIGKGSMVSVMVPRGENMVLCPLAVMKTGAAYQPLDHTYPEERLLYMMKDSGAALLIADRKLLDRIPGNTLPVLFTEDIQALPDCDEIPAGPDGEDLMILLYTSGTTGQPKGVMIAHKNLVNFCAWYRRYYELDRDCVVSAYAGFGFDVCMMDLYPALTTGAAVCVVPDEIRMDLQRVKEYFEEHNVTHAFMTTQLGRLFAERFEVDSLRHLSVAGERLSPVKPPKGYILHNGYGPTECTVLASVQPVNTMYDRVPIGVPLDNYKLYVADSDGHELPVGAMGELWIAGYGVALGYLNLPEKTAQTFIDNPFSTEEGYSKVYRTGDLVRRMNDGRIDFIGRNDGQVKIRGFRIELTEVELVIRSFPGINDVTVQAFPDEKNGGMYLAAYFTSDKKTDAEEIKAYIRKQKPAYMVPAAIMQLDAIPFNQNQKVNKRALPKPVFETGTKYTAPETPLEEEFCAQYAEILGMERVSATDSFFEIGGTSLTAARVIMYAMNKGYPIAYQDVFNHPSPRQLAALIQHTQMNTPEKKVAFDPADYDYTAINKLISADDMEHINEFTVDEVGDIALTGATGFLGIHVLKHFIDNADGKAYCLVRAKDMESAEDRLMRLLKYYFDEDADKALFRDRIICLAGDITQPDTLEQLGQSGADILINCAACVKHFVKDDLLDRMNVQGVQNLVKICLKYDMKLIQVSTCSVAGETEKTGDIMYLHENELFRGQITKNDYVRTKFMAERYVLQEKAEHGLRAVIVRVGNLMSRVSDGEFQINSMTNSFMNNLRAYTILGKFPVEMLEQPAEFSPIDSTAAAIFALAHVDGPFSIFHAYNNHLVTMADVLSVMQEYGFSVQTVPMTEFMQSVEEMSRIPEKSRSLLGLVAYNNSDGKKMYMVGTDNRFTVNVLYRFSFLWPIIDRQYLYHMLESLDTLGFFDETDLR